MPGRRRRLRRGAFAVAAAAALYGVALAWSAVQTDRHLRDAQVAVGLLRADLVRRDAPATEVEARLRQVQREADAARALTSGPVWQLASAVPIVGRPFTTVAGASVAVADLSHQVLPELRAVQHELLTRDLHRLGGVDLAPITAAREPLARAHTKAQEILARVRALPATTGIGAVDRARTQLVGQVGDLCTQLSTTHDVVTLVPPMMGADGTRRYLVAFENSTEARGLGGLPGAYAILRADRGRLTFEHFGVDSDFGGLRVGLGGLSAGYAQHFQGAAPDRFFGNTTSGPHFPDAAKLLMRFWQARSGQHLDGAIATDPSALAMLLAVTGPTRLADGTVLNAANVVSLTERDAYARFTDPVQRKAFLVVVAKAVADDVLQRGPARAVALADALGQAVGQRRLMLYSTRPAEQQVLARQPVGGTLSDTSGLFSAVVINNGGGNKLDYYLARDVTYRSGSCQGGQRPATVTIRLTNGAPRSGLTDYVAGRADLPRGSVPPGTNRLLVSYYATRGAGFDGATLDGRQALLTVDAQAGRPVFTSELEISPGQTRTLVLHVLEPASAAGPVTTLVQPLVLPQTTHVAGPVCAAAPAPR
ncbi:DUF4012 domain-containing protein [Oryzihumus sp.]